MVRLTLLNGTASGETVVAKRFPFHVGRAAANDWCLPQPGVWDRHFALELACPPGIAVRAASEALLMVNGSAVREARLRNGDVLELGAARLQFGLAETRQRTFRLREWSTWAGVLLLCLLQLLLIGCFLP
jgi:predicted component of type VI protein secretion system